MGIISFKENSFNTVIITVSPTTIIAPYSASVLVNDPITDKDVFEFDTISGSLLKVGQTLTFNIPSNLSKGKSGNFKWQLKLFTTEADVIEFDIFDFIVIPSINL